MGEHGVTRGRRREVACEMRLAWESFFFFPVLRVPLTQRSVMVEATRDVFGCRVTSV